MKNKIANKILCKELDAMSEEALQRWINENSENKATYERIARGELATVILEQEKLKLGERLATKVLVTIHRKKLRIRLVAISAAVACMALVIVVLNSSPEVIENKPVEEIAQSVQVQKQMPMEKVVLITTEGTAINLEKSTDLTSLLKSNTDSEKYALNTIIIPSRKEFNFELPDGTKVWLNSSSKLIFPNKFSDTLRQVELIGEAFFEVTKNKKAPFIVVTKSLNTRVLGTQFMVTAYDGNCDVALVEGSVRVSLPKGSNTVLTPGKCASFDAEKREFNVTDIDTNAILSRRNGYFLFDNVPLEEIINSLELWYGIDFSYEEGVLRSELFYLKSLKSDDPQEVLELLKYTKKIDFIITQDKVTIKPRVRMN